MVILWDTEENSKVTLGKQSEGFREVEYLYDSTMLDPQMGIVADTFFWKIDDGGPQLFKGANKNNIV